MDAQVRGQPCPLSVYPGYFASAANEYPNLKTDKRLMVSVNGMIYKSLILSFSLSLAVLSRNGRQLEIRVLLRYYILTVFQLFVPSG